MSKLRDLFEKESLGAPENAVGFVLWRVMHRYQREIDRVLLPLNLTHLQFTVLAIAAWLSRDGNPVIQTEVAKAGAVHPMQISHMLKALSDKRMIERARDDGDIRAKRVQVTDMGIQALRHSLPLVIDVQRRMFGNQGLPGGAFLEALRKVEMLENFD
jgi:MarR family transcriptional regulator, organic hydroperoxide resistance regulator